MDVDISQNALRERQRALLAMMLTDPFLHGTI